MFFQYGYLFSWKRVVRSGRPLERLRRLSSLPHALEAYGTRSIGSMRPTNLGPKVPKARGNKAKDQHLDKQRCIFTFRINIVPYICWLSISFLYLYIFFISVCFSFTRGVSDCKTTALCPMCQSPFGALKTSRWPWHLVRRESWHKESLENVSYSKYIQIHKEFLQ